MCFFARIDRIPYLLGLALVLAPICASAVPIADVYNTGVDNAGSVLGSGVDDPHYAITSQPAPGGLVDATTPNAYPIDPFGPWVANDSNSRWIGPNTGSAVGPVGQYIYQTTFTLPNDVILSSVSIHGLWGTDDSGVMKINGVTTANVSSGFTSPLASFSISTGFVTGLNTLEFVVQNSGGGPTGLRIDDIVGTYETSSVPDGSDTLLLLGITLAMLILAPVQCRITG